MERGKKASLLFSSKDAMKYPMRIRGRVVEAYNAYVSGYYFACIATCRSLLEYVLVYRARSNTEWKFDPYDIKSNGERELKVYMSYARIFPISLRILTQNLILYALTETGYFTRLPIQKRKNFHRKARQRSNVLRILSKLLRSYIARFTPNKANSLGQISATFVCAMNSTSLKLLQFAGDLRR